MTSSWLRTDRYRLGQGHDHNEGCLAGSRWAGDGSPCPQEILGINPRVLLCYAVLSHFSCVRLLLTLWAVARQAPPRVGLSRQEYWSGLPCPPPGDLPDPGIKPASLMSSALAGRFFTTWEAS